MLVVLLVGTGVSLLNIAIHAGAMAVLVHAVGSRFVKAIHSNALARLVIVMVTAVAVLMAAHIVEVGVWSALYQWVGATPGEANDFGFAFVNYTTLGYGNIVPVPQWELLGPMTAMNGVLLFGWSTAVLFQVLTVSYKELEQRL
ncbi:MULTISPECIES: potassium channel family protein [Microbaculum]|uniref:Potassium channel family protein n=1 Tax=Microbaculum marinisediminis TaxID=2931392 RepID=A0AAW5QYE8_9HYPH|nr:potassium channel family protein [Microbaculum sp. A6E488]MCT8972157.1 potassium channel family protein [Microbaculum sp. A6E488]